MKQLRQAEVVIIGAGPAGTLAAALLRQRGYTVTIVERGTFPRFQIGESLLPRCMDHLKTAGLLDELEAAGFQRKYGAWFFRGDQRSGFDFAEQFSGGFEYTWQVPRDDFDHLLAQLVIKRGVSIAWETEVIDFIPASSANERPRLHIRHHGNVEVLSPQWVLDASGYGRVLARLLNLAEPSSEAPRQALFAHVEGDIRETGRDAGRIWACIHPDQAWVWVIPFADGRTSVGIVSSPEFFLNYDDNPSIAWRQIIDSEPNLQARLANAQLCFTPRTLRDYSASVQRLHGPGYALLGNAAEFLDPIFSSGVTLAMESAHHAVSCLDLQLRGETVNWDKQFERPIRRAVDVFRSYVSAWYDGRFQRLIFADNPDPQIRRMLCSVLAGHVHDHTNPFVAQHRRKIDQILRVIEARESAVIPT